MRVKQLSGKGFVGMDSYVIQWDAEGKFLKLFRCDDIPEGKPDKQYMRLMMNPSREYVKGEIGKFGLYSQENDRLLISYTYNAKRKQYDVVMEQRIQ